MRSSMRTFLKVAASIGGATVVSFLGYAAYIYGSYSRIEDNVSILPKNRGLHELPAGVSVRFATFNIGYGAYSSDYSFFMDGGKESVARSSEAVRANILGVAELLDKEGVDIAMLQEVDRRGRRSRDVDEWAWFESRWGDRDALFMPNYHSSFLFWPPLDPIGSAESGIAIFSRYRMDVSVRRQLPISTKPNKILDLDRGYSVTPMPVDNGRTLYLYHLHLTAYGGGPDISAAQIGMLMSDMAEKIALGHYVLCAGDFNHDLPGDSVKRLNADARMFGWCRPFPGERLPKGMRYVEPENPQVGTSRLLDAPYTPGKSFTATIDGFLASDNIRILRVRHIDAGFEYSDHNPVILDVRFD